MALNGAIAERARGIIPATWTVLSEDSGRYGDGLLQTVIDTTKERVLGDADATEDFLPLIVIDYLAKLTVLEIIPAGIDYWHREGPISIGTTGTNEQESFSDPIVALQQLREHLLADTRRIWPDVKPLIAYARLSTAPRPAISTLNDDFLTPSPQEFPRPYRPTDFT